MIGTLDICTTNLARPKSAILTWYLGLSCSLVMSNRRLGDLSQGSVTSMSRGKAVSQGISGKKTLCMTSL